jgi:hypothetical protein
MTRVGSQRHEKNKTSKVLYDLIFKSGLNIINISALLRNSEFFPQTILLHLF